MKVKLEYQETPPLKFPVLMQFKREPRLVVLFTGKEQGTVISADPTNIVGDFKTGLVSCENSQEWKYFTGFITLQND